MLKGLLTFLNSSLGLLLVGFSLTTLLGTTFTAWMQQRAWNHQTQLEQRRQDFEWERSRKFELLRRKLDDGQKSLEEISDLVNLRFFRLQKVYEAVASGQMDAVDGLWEDYMETVERWNVKLIINQNKLERLVDSNAARQFNNYETDNPQLTEPASLHGHFFMTHRRISSLVDCSKKASCQITNEMKSEANRQLRALDYFSDAFVDDVSTVFLERTFALEEFKTLETANKPPQPTQ